MSTDPLWCYENYEEAAQCIDLQEAEIARLKAHINILREALEEMVAMEELEGTSCEPQRAILAQTPAQSLQAFENEVIARLKALLRWHIRTYRVDDELWNPEEEVDRIMQKELEK